MDWAEVQSILEGLLADGQIRQARTVLKETVEPEDPELAKFILNLSDDEFCLLPKAVARARSSREKLVPSPETIRSMIPNLVRELARRERTIPGDESARQP